MKKDGFLYGIPEKEKKQANTGRDRLTQTNPKDTFHNNTLIGQIFPVEN